MRTVLLVLMLALSFTASGEEQTPATGWCLDKERNAQWGEQIKKFPQDPAIVHLFALRHGLCQMLEAEMIELDFAIDLWEQQRALEVQRRQEEERNQQKNPKS